MQHLFVPYELAKQLKEKGFNEMCMATHYHKGQTFLMHSSKNDEPAFSELNSPACSAPLYQQVVDWFREKHELRISVDFDKAVNKWFGKINGPLVRDILGFTDDKNTHYEALTKAIEEALKLI